MVTHRSLLAPALCLALTAAVARSQPPPPRPGLSPAELAQLAPVPATPASQPAGNTLPRPENLQTFTPQALQLGRENGHWVLTAFGQIMKDFGRRGEEGREVLRLIQQMGLNQRATLGVTHVVMEYWLRDGKPPASMPRGVRSFPLALAETSVEQCEGCWVVRDRGRVLFNFGPHEQEARQALAVMRKYGFNRVGVVGQAVPAMIVFANDGALPDNSSPLASRQRPTNKILKTHDKPGRDDRPKPEQATNVYPTAALPPLRDGNRPAQLLERGKPAGLNHPAAPESLEATIRAGVTVERVAFDYRRATVRRDGPDWVVACGSLVLGHFGANHGDAQQALAVVMHYRLTEMYSVGSGVPVFRYFLSSAQAPRGSMVGVMSERFVPEQIEVRQLGQDYWLSQRSRPVLNCGKNPADAQHLLRAVRHHKFDNLVRIGATDQLGMAFFVRGY
jgi:hypothetical protein